MNSVFPRITHANETIGIVGEYTPDNLPRSITNLISMGMTVTGADGKVIGAIAERWEASDSGKMWTFYLKKDLKWQDGANVTSNDINYNFNDAEVTKSDKYTITYKLNTGFAPFPVTLSRPIFKTGLLGLGEWRVVRLSLAGTFVETLTLEDKNKDTRTYKFYPTESRAKLAYQLGQVDKLNDLTKVEPFENWNTLDLEKKVNKQRYVALFLNTSDNITADKEFRQALNYAIDKSKFGEDRAVSPISSGSWVYNPSVKPYNQDIKHAKELISSAEIDPEAKKSLKMKLTTVSDLLPLAEEIQKNWKEIGIETTIQVTSYVPDDFQAHLAIYDVPSDPDQYAIWHSSQLKNNITRFKNVRIDKLLEDGRLETNSEKRRQIYFDFQRFLVEDTPAIFLYYPSYFNVSRI